MIRILLISILLFLNIPSAYSQLSGNYTIGGSTGASNFATWTDFAQEFNKVGTSGKVKVTIQNNTTISSRVELKQHTTYPTTSSNTLVFVGNGYSITGSNPHELLLLDGVDYVEISNVKFINTSNNDSLIGIRITNNADFNIFNGCTIQFTGTFKQAKHASAFVAFAENNRNLLQLSRKHLGTNNTIKYCTFSTTATNSPGPYYGILHQGGIDSFNSSGTKNTFEGNNIQNFYSSAIFSRYSNGDRWLSNVITRTAASSSSAVDSNLVAIKIGKSYSGTQSTLINGNTIKDLPFIGASGTSTIRLHSFSAIRLDSCQGTSSTNFYIENNTITNNIGYRYFVGIVIDQGLKIIIKKNLLSKNRCYLNYYSYSIKISGTTDLMVVQNHITKEKMGELSSNRIFYCYVVHCSYLYNRYWQSNTIEENIIDSNSWQRECFVFFTVNLIKGGISFNKNQVINNRAPGLGGNIVVFDIDNYFSNVNVVANLVAKNSIDTFGTFLFVKHIDANNSNTETNICNNTVYFESKSNHRYGPVGFYLREYQKTNVTGNIIYFDCPNSDYAVPVQIYHYVSAQLEINHNTYFVKSKTETWNITSNNKSNFSDYKSLSLVGSAENNVKVKFSDIPKNDFRQYTAMAQNNVPYRQINEKDIYQRVRNKKFHDRGAIETYFDLAADTSNLNIPTEICSGWQKEVGIRIKNNNADTVYDFHVAYSINNIKNRELVTHRIASKDTYTYYFKTPLIINSLDSVEVKLFIDANDDTLSNDTFVFKTFVKESPGGSEFLPVDTIKSPNPPIYRSNGKPDVTVVGSPVLYTMPPPRKYSNSQFGTGWSASASAYTLSGKKIPGTTLTNPSGTADLSVKFETMDTALENTVIQIAVTFSNYKNSCDTTLLREIFIAPLAWANFKSKTSACTGDTISFENTSTIKNGYYYSTWNFGTGVVGDTSSDINSTHVFIKPGIFKVRLTTKTLDIGFVNNKEIEVVITTTPTVDFTKKNGCARSDALFTNNSTPANSHNYWDFGDGKGEIRNDSATINHIYSVDGIYNVKLRVDNKGCIATSTKKIQQFETPIAAFDHVSGRCSHEIFKFTNKSILKSDSYDSKWTFNNLDSVSTSKHGETRFSKGGKNWVQLIVKSSIGCSDTLTKEILAYQTPNADFEVDRACKYVVSKFLNNTAFDTTYKNRYNWDFGDGTKSTLKSPTKKWNSLGTNTVILLVESDNFCKDTVSKNIQVLESVFPAFSANNACSGVPIVFKNSTTWESGEINYRWDFADNTFDKEAEPTKTFNPKRTTSYFVTLWAAITGGCSDSITQRVDIYETPNSCSVDAVVDYSVYHWGIKALPKDNSGNVGGQDNVEYTFWIPGIDTVTVSNSGAYAMLNAKSDGIHQVFMTAKMSTNGNCTCSGNTIVTLDRLGLTNYNSQDLWRIMASPNPNNGHFKIEVFGAQQVKSLRVKTINGSTLLNLESPDMIPSENHKQELWLEQLQVSPGVYFLEVTTDAGTKSVKLMVQ